MSRCQTCVHYRYSAGVAPSLAKILNKQLPSRATNYCDYAQISWERNSAEVKKPRGIKCDYKIKEMYCDDCGKLLKNNSDVWMILTSESYICNKCGKKRESFNEQS